jgi:ATP-dependent Clp protease ATP-binding subunit ClpA
MPKINVYLPDDLAAAVKAAEIPVSAVCQKALADAVQVVTVARKGIAALRDPDFDPGARPEFAARLADRMTDRLRASIELGRGVADGGPVTTGSLLVGVIDEGGNLAVRLLQALDGDLDQLREAALTSAAEEPLPTAAAGTEGFWSRLTMPVRSAIGAALEASIELGHNYIGCEHLLLGLVAEQDGAAGQVLRAAGAELRSTRGAVSAALAGFVHHRDQAGGKPSDPVAAVAALVGKQLKPLLDRLDRLERHVGLE